MTKARKGNSAHNRLRLTDEEIEIVNAWREKGNLPALLEECKKNGIPIANVRHYWHKSQQFSIFAKHEEKSLEDTFEPILADLRKFSPKFKKIKRKPVSDPHCLVLDPADVHVGKLAVKSETGNEYNIEFAVNQVDEAVEGLLEKAYGFNLNKIIIVIGNDCLHTDTPRRTTTSGTPQDTSGMWHEAFLAAKDMYVRMIERCVSVADVHVVFNPSNHDYMSGWMLAQTIEAYYRFHDNISFDTSIKHRKYTQYGNSMIGTSHGDGAKLEKIGLLMAQEEPQMWVDTKYRYSYQHHVHHKQQWKFLAALDGIGITIEYLRSPSGTDGWHHRNGYTGNKKAVEAFVHSMEDGQVARLTHLF